MSAALQSVADADPWAGGWHGAYGVPMPGIVCMRHGHPYCNVKSPPMQLSGVKHDCSRRRGHTGRHAAYGSTEVLAVWA